MRDLVADDVLKFSGQLGFYEHIARIEKSLCTDTLSITDSIDFFCRNQNLRNQILKTAPLDFLFEILFGFLFLSACCSKHIPLLIALAHNPGILECVDCRHQMLETEVHCEDNNGKNHRCNHHYDS